MKLIIAVLLLCLTAIHAQADQLDSWLKNKRTMVAAVVLLGTVPPKCLYDKRRPTTEELAAFILHYGHIPNDAFQAEMKAHAQTIFGNEGNALFDRLSKTEQGQTAEMTCAYSALLSAKLRQVSGP
jgi:hypothetical protein